MIDDYGRTIDYMRISVTDRCNLRCVYCMPKSGVCTAAQDQLLSDDEIVRIVEAAARAGIRHIKVTGGEPLLRENVTGLIRRLKQISGIETVTLTTNGILLPEYIEELVSAGISGINISLDTLDAMRYKTITRGGDLEKALEGVRTASAYKELTTKVNAVLSEKNWQEDALALAKMAETEKIHVRFIEHMPLGTEADERPVLEEDILKILCERYGKGIPCDEKIGEGPSHYFAFPRLTGRIGFISAMSHKFCSGCNRIRLTADGCLRMCLQSREGLSLRDMLRGGISDEKLAEVMSESVHQKPEAHCMTEQKIEAEGMCQIGG